MGKSKVCNFEPSDKRPWEEIASSPTLDFSCKLQSRQCEAPECKRRTRKALPYCFWHQRSLLHVIIKKSKIPHAGLGLFACDPHKDDDEVIFTKGDAIALYARRNIPNKETLGEFMSESALLDRYGECLTAPYGVDTTRKKTVVDTACQRSIASYANNAPSYAQANAELLWVKNQRGNELMLFAKKTIHNGEEITWHYGKDYRYDYPPIFQHRVWHTARAKTNPKCKTRRQNSGKRRKTAVRTRRTSRSSW